MLEVKGFMKNDKSSDGLFEDMFIHPGRILEGLGKKNSNGKYSSFEIDLGRENYERLVSQVWR